MNKQLISKSTSKGKRVFVGLSGGVDSAVSAALLKEQGYDVTGVFIKVWHPDFLPCTWREERRDAMRVAARLNIPFLFFDFEEEYKKGVADYMIKEYALGRTPNPDVMCNREIKFGAFLKKAREMGADFIATGHYARNDSNVLKEGKDTNKDQSYFLWTLTPEDLSHVLFPIGNLEKPEVRALAEKFNLPVAEKKDSQGICFLGKVGIEEFLSHFITVVPGNVLDLKGNVVGTHHGAIYYTLGERHGFEITKNAPDSKAFYVIAKDITNNTITVSDNPAEITSHLPTKMKLQSVNWISNSGKSPVTARIRYHQEKFPVKVDVNQIVFSTPQTAAPGQSIVFYAGDVCLGGGILV